jgi:hypothetical protein
MLLLCTVQVAAARTLAAVAETTAALIAAGDLQHDA